MATIIRPELSEKNKYWIEKHRYYELKHFCLQYHNWKKEYYELDNNIFPTSIIEYISYSGNPTDLTSKYAIKKSQYSDKINLIESAAMQTDDQLYMYIIKAVTENLSYTYLKTKLEMPCGKSLYYDRYRKFFWILNKLRE